VGKAVLASDKSRAPNPAIGITSKTPIGYLTSVSIHAAATMARRYQIIPQQSSLMFSLRSQPPHGKPPFRVSVRLRT